jgi:hypothetical protein
MNRRFARAACFSSRLGLALAALLACEGNAVPEDENGQTGSIGSAECLDDAMCDAKASGMAVAFTEPLALPSPFVSATCIQVGLTVGSDSYEGLACECESEDGWNFLVGPPGVPCLVEGRTGECLWESSQLGACDPGDPSSCDPICEEAEEYLATRAESSYDAEVRLARCNHSTDCETVLRVGERCTADGNRFFDCSLSDEEILEQSRAAAFKGGEEGTPTCDEFVPRDPNEWQGIRVETCREQYCETSDQCGLALACIDGGCGACFADSDCARGEVCVLDHCLLDELATCRSYQDCDEGEVCIFGLSGGVPRGNEDSPTECIGSSGGTAR